MSSKKSIAELAYQLWNERGRPHGSEEEDWAKAQRQLAAAEEADRVGETDDGPKTAPDDIDEG